MKYLIFIYVVLAPIYCFGDIELMYSRDEAICANLIENAFLDRSYSLNIDYKIDDYSFLETGLSDTMSLSGEGIVVAVPYLSIQKLQFDINNDSIADNVIVFSNATTSRPGPVYFVVTDLERAELYYTDIKRQIMSVMLNPLWLQEYSYRSTQSRYHRDMLTDYFSEVAIAIYPQFWIGNDYREIFSGLFKSQAMELAGIDSDYNLRYIEMVPFQYENKTYMWVRSVQQDKFRISGIFMGNPDYSMTEMCYFRYSP